MPRVPRISEERVPLRALPALQPPPTPPVEALGGGPAAREFGTQARGLARDVTDLALRERRAADQIAVTEYDNALANRKLDLIRDARKLKGKNSFGAVDTFMTQFGENADLLDADLNRRQLPSARNRRTAHEIELRGKLEDHTNRERFAYDNNTTEARLQTYRNEALDSIGNPVDIRRKVDLGTGEIMDFAERNGLSPEDRNLKIAEYRSKTHSEVINLMLSQGRETLAGSYRDLNTEEIVGDDKKAVDKMFKVFRNETKRIDKLARTEVQDDVSRELWLNAIDGRVTLTEADDLFRNKRIDRPFYNQLRSRILSRNDDPAIPPEEKTKRYLELFDAFRDLRGAKVDKKGQLIRRASRNDIQTLTEFRRRVSESAGHLTKKQERDFYEFTQRNFDEAREAKMGILNSLLERLRAMSPFAFGPVSLLAAAIEPILSPQVSVEQAAKVAEGIGDQHAIATNPNRTQYKIGQIITVNGMSGKVVGFHPDGEPDIEPLGPLPR